MYLPAPESAFASVRVHLAPATEAIRSLHILPPTSGLPPTAKFRRKYASAIHLNPEIGKPPRQISLALRMLREIEPNFANLMGPMLLSNAGLCAAPQECWRIRRPLYCQAE